jgi:hypothetical protein
MRNQPRNSDGTIRQTNKPRVLTNRSIIARWVEAETLHLKRLGMSYQAIADHIGRVARGQQQGMVPLPEHASFAEDYGISVQAIHRAFKRGMARLPNAEAVELRKLDSERCEGMFLSLQPGMRKGDARSIEVGVRVLVHKADLNGYRAPAKLEIAGKQEMTGKGGGALTLQIVRQFLDATGQEDDEKERGADGDVAK